MRDRVFGLDGYKKRWLGVTLVDGSFHAARVFRTISEALDAEHGCSVVAIDIPIGLATGNGRDADREAKRSIGKRKSSVFPTLPAAVYAAATYPEALALACDLTGSGISKQSYALRMKIREAADAAAADSRVVEVHPEVSFRALAGTPQPFAKKSWNGLMQRRRLLQTAGIDLPEALTGAAGEAAADDVLDAAVAAWSARRVAQGTAKLLPENPSLTPWPRTGVIWY
jgi:predicted RNase H-like nuclease